jgi:hypothetical protein
MPELTLKPLPKPAARRFHYDVRGFDVVPPTLYYTASQVEQIRRDAVRDALGAAADVIDKLADAEAKDYAFGYVIAMLCDCADEIRALMPKEEGK